MFTKLSFTPQDSAKVALELHPHDTLSQFRFVKGQAEVRTFASQEVALDEWNRLKDEGILEYVGDNMRVSYRGYHVYRVFN